MIDVNLVLMTGEVIHRKDVLNIEIEKAFLHIHLATKQMMSFNVSTVASLVQTPYKMENV